MYGATRTATYITRRLEAPPSGAATNTAPTTRLALALAAAGLSPRPAPRLWGSLPLEEIEGHHPDPAYDVRPVEGLGRAPLRSERLSGLGVMRDDGAIERWTGRPELRTLSRPATVVEATTGAGPAATLPSSSSAPGMLPAVAGSSMLVPLALAGALLLLMRR